MHVCTWPSHFTCMHVPSPQEEERVFVVEALTYVAQLEGDRVTAVITATRQLLELYSSASKQLPAALVGLVPSQEQAAAVVSAAPGQMADLERMAAGEGGGGKRACVGGGGGFLRVPSGKQLAGPRDWGRRGCTGRSGAGGGRSSAQQWVCRPSLRSAHHVARFAAAHTHPLINHPPTHPPTCLPSWSPDTRAASSQLASRQADALEDVVQELFCSPEITRQGEMERWDPRTSTWSRRHFVLTRAGYLHCYERMSDAAKCDVLKLSRCEVEQGEAPVINLIEGGIASWLTRGSRKLVLKASSVEEYCEWALALREAIAVATNKRGSAAGR